MNSEELQMRVLAKGAAFVFAGLIVSKILGYTYRLLVARLGTAEYGQLSLGLAVASVLVTVCLFGFPQTLIRYVAYYESRQEHDKLRQTVRFSFVFTFVLGLVAAAALFLASDWVAVTVFNSPGLAVIFKILSIAIPLDIIRNNIWAITKAFRKVEYEVISRHLAENVLKVAATAIFLYFGFRLLGAALAYLVAVVASFLIAAYFLRKLLPARPDGPPAGIHKELLSYTAPLLLTNAIIPIIAWADTLMLGYFKSVSDVGIYNAAAPTALLMYFFPSMVLPLFAPVLVTLYAQQEKETMSAIYAAVTKWILMVNTALLVVFAMLSSRLLGVLFGQEYAAGGSILIGLAMGHYVYHTSLTCNAVLLTFKYTKLAFVIFLFGGILNVVMNFFLIPVYGMVGAATATATSLVFMGFAHFFFAWQVTGMRQFRPSHLKIAFSAAVAGVAAYIAAKLLWHLPDMAFLLTIAAIVISIYAFSLLVMRAFTKTDANILRAIQQKTGIRMPLINKFMKKFM